VNVEAIKRGEDRQEFKNTMARLGIDMPGATLPTAWRRRARSSSGSASRFVIRPATPSAGTGGGFAYNLEELETIVSRGLSMSLVGQVLVRSRSWAGRSWSWRSCATPRAEDHGLLHRERGRHGGAHRRLLLHRPMLTIAPALQERLQRYSYAIVDAIE